MSEDDGFRLEDLRGIRAARCGALLRLPGIAHVVTARGFVDDAASREAAFRAAGFRGPGFALPRQVHGTALVDAAPWGEAAPDADGVLLAPIPAADAPAPAVRAADCVPILLADAAGGCAAAVHAGWRGTAAGIGERAVAALAARGFSPSGLIAALGPSIGPCCYEVGDEVVEALLRTGAPRGRIVTGGASGRPRVDLHQANRFQLERAGVPPASIHMAPWCTRCRNDLFHSARAEGAKAGRMIAAIGRGASP